MSATEFSEESELKLEELITLVEGTISDIEDFVSENSLTEEDLENLITAEKAGKNRETAIEFLRNKKTDIHTEGHVEKFKNNLKEEHGQERLNLHEDAAEIDIGKLKMVLSPRENPFLVLDVGDHRIPLRNSSLDQLFRQTGLGNIQPYRQVAGVAGQAPNVRQQPNNSGGMKNATPQNQQMSANSNGSSTKVAEPTESSKPESSSKKSKTNDKSSNADYGPSPREELENKLKSKFNLEEEKLKGKTLSELKDLEDDLYQKQSLKTELKNKFGLKDIDVNGKSLEDLEDLRDRLEDKSALRQEIKDKFDVDPGDRSVEELKNYKESLMSISDKKAELKKRFDIKEERMEGLELEGLKNLENKLEKRQQLINRLQSYGYSKKEINNKEHSYLENELEDIKEKKSIIEDLEIDFEDTELKDLDISELRAIKSEKMEREQIISDLSAEGLDEDDLRNSSTKDLRKLKSEMLAPDTVKTEENSEKVSDKEISEIEKEAAEELEMLMGVVEDDNNLDESQSDKDHPLGKLKGLKKEFSDLMKNKDAAEEDDKNIREDKVRNLLEDYKNSDEHVGKAIKTAQVMKGYVEYKLGVNRELTYQELSDKISEMAEEQENRDLKTLGEFFGQIHHQIYSGNVYVENIDEVITCSERVIEGSE